MGEAAAWLWLETWLEGKGLHSLLPSAIPCLDLQFPKARQFLVFKKNSKECYSDACILSLVEQITDVGATDIGKIARIKKTPRISSSIYWPCFSCFGKQFWERVNEDEAAAEPHNPFSAHSFPASHHPPFFSRCFSTHEISDANLSKRQLLCVAASRWAPNHYWKGTASLGAQG